MNHFAFIVGLISPLIIWRTLCYLFNGKMPQSPIRNKTKFNVHHFHYGIVILILGIIMLLILEKNWYVFLILGFGLGNILDEFTSSLKLNSDRTIELNIYNKELKNTIFVFIVLIIITILSYLIF